MKDRVRHTRVPYKLQADYNRQDRRKEKRVETRDYRLHRKGCLQCRQATKLPDKVLSDTEKQARRCITGQELFLQGQQQLSLIGLLPEKRNAQESRLYDAKMKKLNAESQEMMKVIFSEGPPAVDEKQAAWRAARQLVQNKTAKFTHQPKPKQA